MNIAKEYNVEIGLTPSDIEAIVNGEMSTLHFLPTDDTDYEDKISVHLKPISEDATLDECMNLVVDTWNRKEWKMSSITKYEIESNIEINITTEDLHELLGKEILLIKSDIGLVKITLNDNNE